MEWNPYREFDQDSEILPIDQPPCPFCSYWKPQRLYDGTQYVGLILCHLQETTERNMMTDFSCFVGSEAG